jgi:exodeoxyribonuclease X
VIVTVVDTETTGLSHETDRVVEIAGVFLDTERDDLTWTSSLIDPGRDVPPEASAVHHLTADDVRGKPTLGEFLAGENDGKSWLRLAAHNMQFDWGFLRPYFGEKTQRICTWRCSMHVWPEAPEHKNQSLRYWLGLKPELPSGLSPHRALYDALVTTAILRRLLMERSVEQLIELSSTPVLLSTIRFGKYRGTRWADADPGYLGWVLSKNFDEDVRHTARHYLERRRGT